MRTDISAELRQLPEVQLSESILRNCVHCGFCNATCPTYLLTGNELEGPRGRIYLMKSVLEERIEPSLATLSHIDNCLGCLACETTCPSGVRYSTLLEDARPRLEALGLRPWWQRLQRRLLTTILPHPGRLRLSLALSRIGRLLPALVPRTMHHLLSMAPRQLPTPARVALPGTHPAEGGQRIRVLLLTGCAQQVLGAAINDATVRLLTRLGAQVTIPEAEICCGSLTYHMGERRKSRRLMATTLRRWHRVIAEGTDYIVSTTSGCSTTIADYVHIFAEDPELAPMAEAVCARLRDVSQTIAELGLPEGASAPERLRIAYHDACSLQHGLHVREQPRSLLSDIGFGVEEIAESHICCGSAGTYNLLNPEMASQLQARKVEHIRRQQPDLVAAGNIGCIEQIGGAISTPVVHTVQLLDWATGGPDPRH